MDPAYLLPHYKANRRANETSKPSQVANGIELQVEKRSPDAVVPVRGSAHAAGYDLASCEKAIVPKWGRKMIDTGIAIKTPDGYYSRIAPRSGLAVKNGIDVLAGVVDSDYTGNVKVVLQNLTDTPFIVEKGDRIAQLIVQPYASPQVKVVSSLSETERGHGGFGSTGMK